LLKLIALNEREEPLDLAALNFLIAKIAPGFHLHKNPEKRKNEEDNNV